MAACIQAFYVTLVSSLGFHPVQYIVISMKKHCNTSPPFFSFNDISSQAIIFDGVKVVVGYLVMFVYPAIAIGRGLEKGIYFVHRIALTASGIVAVAMGLHRT